MDDVGLKEVFENLLANKYLISLHAFVNFPLFLTFHFNFYSLHKLKNHSVEICREPFKDFISACTSLKQITVLFVLNDHWIFIQAVN